MDRARRHLQFLIALTLYSLNLACARVSPTAPNGSILYASANPPSVSTGGATSIITVMGYDAQGIPLSDGTAISFMTDIGTIDAKAATRNGRAQAVFRSDARSGEAHILVTSGNAKAEVKVLVGLAALVITAVVARVLTAKELNTA